MKGSSNLKQAFPLAIALSAALSLTACGGGDTSPAESPPPPLTLGEPGAPRITGNTAADGFNRMNFRRQQMGLVPLVRNASVDTAAQMHSDYQRINNLTTHVEDPTMPGFTGVEERDRLQASSYLFLPYGYAIGEVIASRSNASGSDAAEDLIGAVYDRFTMFEPVFKEAGVGAATSAGGTTWFTADFAAIGLDGGLPPGQMAVYPFAGQTGVPTGVDSDAQALDPVPNQNRVGYPVSVHANLGSTVAVQSFTIKPHGGVEMTVRTLTHSSDLYTPASAASIIPLSALAPATVYDVQFTGTVDGSAVTRSWSFTTQ